MVACLLAVGTSGDDSLRSALHAVQKRQRDLATPQPLYYSRPNFVYGDGQPEDIGYGYQKSVPGTAGVFDSIALPYTELGANYEPEALALQRMLPYEIDRDDIQSKRSVFRERGEGSDPNQLIFGEEQDEETPYFIPSPFRERMAEKSRLQNAHALVRNYAGLNRNPEDQIGDEDYVNVLNSIWEKYKGEEDPEDITEADVQEILEYLANKEERKRQYGNFNTGYDFFNSPLGWSKRSLRDEPNHKRYQETLFDERYPYRGGQKRYPITKRSPTPLHNSVVSHRHKKNASDKQTDPKVAAELSNIFQTEQKKNKKNATIATSTVPPNVTQAPGQKEQTVENGSLKPLDVKKKSINWSDYFGIDRRKKSTGGNEVNNDWLLKKYLEAYGIGKDKDAMMGIENQKKRPEDVDTKIKAMEDSIVDQAIKYTGAHEGITDSKEIQEVKDRVIAELAAAYSLEKMRRALGELKASMAAQKASASPSHNTPLSKSIESKRLMKETSEPTGKFEKKEAEQQNEIIDFGNLPGKDCPVLRGVEMRCKKIASLTGDATEVFLPLCNLHHMCYLCGPVLRAASPRECDTAFLEESENLCRDEPTCYYLAGKTLSIARSLKPDPNLVCDWRNSPCLAQFLSLTTDKR